MNRASPHVRWHGEEARLFASVVERGLGHQFLADQGVEFTDPQLRDLFKLALDAEEQTGGRLTIAGVASLAGDEYRAAADQLYEAVAAGDLYGTKLDIETAASEYASRSRREAVKREGLRVVAAAEKGDRAEAENATERIVKTLSATKGKPQTVCLQDVEPEEVEWLWPGRVPLGKITLLDGDPNLGKSTVALDLSARVSSGRPMPDEDMRGEPADVLLVCPEDGLADTIRPRLGAAGADVSRVHAFTDLITIPDDLPKLEAEIERVNARMVIIDPLTAVLGERTNSYRDQDVRRALAPLALLAERTHVAVLLVRHLTKGNGTSAIYRGGGSIGITAAARSAILFAKNPENDDERIAVVYKSNLAPPSPALRYRLVSAGGAVQAEWLGEADISPESLLDAAAEAAERVPTRGRARGEAKEYLREILADGPVPARQVYEEAASRGIPSRTLERAKSDLRVRSVRQVEGDPTSPWLWSLLPLANWRSGDLEHNSEENSTISDRHPDRHIDTSSESGDLEYPLNTAENGGTSPHRHIATDNRDGTGCGPRRNGGEVI